MADASWDDWIDRHVTLFGLQWEEEMVQLRGWLELLKRKGYQPAELLAASEAVILAGQPKPSQVLGALVAQVKAARNHVAMRELPKAPKEAGGAQAWKKARGQK